MEVLRHIANSSTSSDVCIPQVSSTLNSSIYSSVNDSSHFILFGCDKRLLLPLVDLQPINNFENYVQFRLADRQRIHQFVKNNPAAFQDTILNRQHQHASTPDIITGDMVFNRVHDRHSKLNASLEGPFAS